MFTSAEGWLLYLDVFNLLHPICPPCIGPWVQLSSDNTFFLTDMRLTLIFSSVYSERGFSQDLDS